MRDIRVSFLTRLVAGCDRAPVNRERMESPQQFAAQVARHLAAFAEPGVPLPSDDELTALVEAAFFASLHEEEARRIELAVAWQAGAHDCAAVVAITPAVRATPKNLSKLAPATWHEATSIAIRREGEGLVAWALLERKPTARQPLTIRAIAAGVLRVEYADVPRALYARGEIVLLGGANETRSAAARLSRAFAAWRTSDVAAYVDRRARAVTQLAARVLAHGHGGMILVIPAELAMPHGVRIHYAVADGADLLVRDTRDETIDLVARLTAVDNALLLDTDLRVRGFGVQVIEGDTPEMSFAHIDPYTGDSHVDDLSTFKGTRHPAGVVFCMRQDCEAAAIIASQDSQLSIACKDERGVVEVLGSYERGFGW